MRQILPYRIRMKTTIAQPIRQWVTDPA